MMVTLDDSSYKFESIFGDGEDVVLQPGLHAVSAAYGLGTLPTGSVDLIMLDGPYYISNKGQSNKTGYKGTKLTNFGTWDIDLTPEAMREELIECRRVLRDGGSIIQWSGWEALGEIKRIMLSIGLFPKRKVTIVKKNWHPLMAAKGFMNGTEDGIWATTHEDWEHHTYRLLPGNAGSWTYANSPKGKGRIHNCQKDTATYMYFMRPLLIPFRDQVVVEPYAGSAPAAYVARMLGCTYYGFESDPMMVALARKLRRI